MKSNTNKIELSSKRLLSWLEENLYMGYDLYDILDNKNIRAVIYSENLITRLTIAKPLSLLIKLYPYELRKLFRIKKNFYPKAMGLFANAYINLYKINNEQQNKVKALSFLDWLKNNFSKGYSGFAWGYPFDWQSKILIPRDTPSSVVSCIIGDAFWNAYNTFHDETFLNVCLSICEFISKDLKIIRKSENKICFSYTPIDKMEVHNANLFSAEFLIRIGTLADKKKYIDLGLSAANFSISEQLDDGSLNYFSNDQNTAHPNHNDHYHIGFEIRAFQSIYKLTKLSEFNEAVNKYYNYYKKNLLLKNNDVLIPITYPNNPNIIDIHGCAEALILNSYLSPEYTEVNNILENVSTWIIENMQSKKGYFFASKNKVLGIRVTDTTPYIRWGQAWMLYALSCYSLLLHNQEEL